MKDKQLIIYLILCMLLGAASLRLSAQTGVSLRPRVYLQGALHGLLPTATLMRDDLRAKGLIPLTEPYSTLYLNIPHTTTPHYQHVGGGGETISDPAVLGVTGPNAIVDWVFLELRDTNFLDVTLATRSALVQRDGDVVDVDGVSPISFPTQAPGNYHVVIRHRNHLGAMSGIVSLNASPITLDFTNPNTEMLCVSYVMATIGNKQALWGGDLNGNGRMVYQGPLNDILILFLTTLQDPLNTLHLTNFPSQGYLQADLNMDGLAIYTGPNNDRAKMFEILINRASGIDFIYTNDYVPIECVP